MMSEDIGLWANSKFSLKQIAAHELSKICWGNFVLKENNNEFINEKKEVKMLKIHRNKIINQLPQILNSLPKAYAADFPKLLMDTVVNAVFNLHRGYKEALYWETACYKSLPFTIFNPVTAGKYQAVHFINPSGHFDDLIWAKYFVADENQFVYCRFELACIYCFEDKIIYTSSIWKSAPFGNSELSWGKVVERRKQLDRDLIRIWMFQIENRFDELIEIDHRYNDGFLALGFRDAMYCNHFHAAKFFWTRCSEEERFTLISEYNFARLLSFPAMRNQPFVVHFIYSNLTRNEKEEMFFNDMLNLFQLGFVEVYACLLNSPYYKCVLDDILGFPSDFSLLADGDFFAALTFKMRDLEKPIDKEIFKTLWNLLSNNQRKEILIENGKLMLRDLAKIQAIDLLELIIQPLSLSLKDKMLLYDWQKVGMSALTKFSNQGAKDMMISYLLFYLFDFDSVTQKKRLRDDALNFLNILNKGIYKYWKKGRISKLSSKFFLSESGNDEICKVIENLQGSLSSLNNIFDHLE